MRTYLDRDILEYNALLQLKELYRSGLKVDRVVEILQSPCEDVIYGIYSPNLYIGEGFLTVWGDLRKRFQETTLEDFRSRKLSRGLGPRILGYLEVEYMSLDAFSPVVDKKIRDQKRAWLLSAIRVLTGNLCLLPFSFRKKEKGWGMYYRMQWHKGSLSAVGSGRVGDSRWELWEKGERQSVFPSLELLQSNVG